MPNSSSAGHKTTLSTPDATGTALGTSGVEGAKASARCPLNVNTAKRHSPTTASVPHHLRLGARKTNTTNATIMGSGGESSVPRLTFEVGEQTIKVGPGSFVFGPKDVPHHYTVDSGPARLLFILSLAGFEEFVYATSEPAKERTLPPRARRSAQRGRDGAATGPRSPVRGRTARLGRDAPRSSSRRFQRQGRKQSAVFSLTGKGRGAP
jgi:hypothetical protein